MKEEKKIYNYALDVDEETLRQFKECYSQDFVLEAALMPDAHVGYAAPIGSVLITKAYIVPAWVGFDIGCGLIAVKLQAKNILEKIKENQQIIHRKINNKIPMGVGEYNKLENISEKTKEKFHSLIKEFKKNPYNKEILQYLNSTALKHLGTLGGGNHFIEIGFDSLSKKINKNEVWLIIHSGSRGIGHKIAKRYMISASGSKTDYEKTFPLDVNSQLGKEYLNIQNFALEYALLNRLEMASKVTEVISEILNEKIKTSLWVNKNHNHAVLEKGKFIHRKGATPAKKGEKGIIPGNMRDGTYLIEGKGSSKFLCSSSHGAGRALSRSSAMKNITLEEFEKSMQGIRANIGQRLIDEAPMAYKNIEKVMSLQKPSVKILKKIKPILNWKGK